MIWAADRRSVFRLRGRGFTLVELLVVIGIIAVLISILLPTLNVVWQSAQKANCMANLKQIGIAIRIYANDNNNDRIPYGPKAPPIFTSSDFYPSTGAPTNLISLSSGKPVGLGLLLQNQLSSQPKVLFCPGSDDPTNADLELSHVGWQQAQCSYFYRHGSNSSPFDLPTTATASVPHIQLSNLGSNRNGGLIHAMAIDTQLLAPPGLEPFGVFPSTHHNQKSCNILFSDGHVSNVANDNGKFTVDLSDYASLTNAFDTILKVLENADLED